MQLSIWQQFSSNHSGFFWVVGTFQSVEAAHAAYDELRQMLFEIDQWHRDHLDESKEGMKTGRSEPFPPEQAFAQKYNVEWKYPIDWTNWANYWLLDYPGYQNINPQGAAESLIDRAISVVGKVVTVTNPDQTWMGVEPFQGILKHQGAITFGYDLRTDTVELSNEWPHTYLNFDAPNSDIANLLEREFQTYFARPLASVENLPPWHDDNENFKHVFDGKSLLQPDAVHRYIEQWNDSYNMSTVIANTSGPFPHYLEMPLKRLAVSRHESFQRAGLHFTFRDLSFANEELGLSAMIAYLEVRGCTNIDFRYSKDDASTNHD